MSSKPCAKVRFNVLNVTITMTVSTFVLPFFISVSSDMLEAQHLPSRTAAVSPNYVPSTQITWRCILTGRLMVNRRAVPSYMMPTNYVIADPSGNVV
jgi:hypothetical protein